MPYTYYLRNKITGEKYYGVRYAKGCHPSELWVTYFSSSKYVLQRIVEYGRASFEAEVRKEFETVAKARNWEERVLRRLNILRREDWLNQNICGKYLWTGKQRPEHIRKRIARMAITRRRRGWRNPPHTQEWRDAIARSLKGVAKTKDHRARMGCHKLNRKTVRCDVCGKSGQYVNMKRWHFENCGKKPEQLICPCGYRGVAPNILRYHFDNCKKGKKNGQAI